MFSVHRQSSDGKWLYDQVTFENVADQYAQGEDVVVSFTLSQSLTTNFDRDEIAITRIGCTNIQECLTFAPVQFKASNAVLRGTATFVASKLSVNDEEFYQFSYIRNKSKSLGLSQPFQLNCTLDDIDYLSDQESEDIVVINTESDIGKGKSCEIDCSEYSERCRTLESINEKNLDELNRVRSQLNAVSQFVKDQATQLLDLERRLIRADQLLKQSNEEKLSLEQQLRDLRLTSEKHQRSAQGQIEHLSATTDPEKLLLEKQLRDLRLTFEKYQLSTQGQLKSYSKQVDRMNELEKTNGRLQAELKSLQMNKQFVEENDLKRQLNVYQKFINDLQNETKGLAERLSSRDETQNAEEDGEVKRCPVCYFHFSPYFTPDQKNEHIIRHLQ